MEIRVTFHVPIIRSIWADVTAAILQPLAIRRSKKLELHILLDATLLLYSYSEAEAQEAILENTDGVADALARAADAGSLSKFVLHISAEQAMESFGDAVEEMRHAFTDKVSPRAGSCKLEVR